MHPAPLVPETFEVPDRLQTAIFDLEPLSPAVVEIDYDAVMSSRARLRSVFAAATEWPRDDMTLEDNLNDLIRHDKEFQERYAFAYTVLSPDRKTCLGCIYINPSSDSEFDCAVYLWIRDSYLELDEELFRTVRDWLENQWPFERVGYPGRDTAYLN